MDPGPSDSVITEDVIARRLIIEGEGRGDERKLNSLLKSYLALTEGDQSEENEAAAMRRFTGLLKQMEFVAERTVESIKVNERCNELYTELGTKVKAEIVETERQIEQSKAWLEVVAKRKRCKMECDALAKLVETKPDRKLMEEKKTNLGQELKDLKKVKETLEGRKRRTVSMLTTTIPLLRELSASVDDNAGDDKSSPSESLSELGKEKEPAAASGSELSNTSDVQNVEDFSYNELVMEIDSEPEPEPGTSFSGATDFMEESENYEPLSE